MKLSLIKITLVIAALGPATLLAQDAVPEKPNESIERRMYPTFKHPPGFYEGVMLIGVMYGKSIAPDGKFIRHEKKFDNNLKIAVETGMYSSSTPVLPDTYYQSEYSPKGTGQVDIEYGAWEHFGLGLSAFQYSIGVNRQDYIPGSEKLTGTVLYESLPRERILFSGNAITMLATYHPLSRRILDPYFCFRAGGVGFSGEAHSGLWYDKNRSSTKIMNGIGKTVGMGAGMNFFFSPEIGIRIEGNYNKNYLSSDLFSTRDLNIYNVQIGIFINYSALAATNY